jgi:hypothetical protein
MHAENPSSPTTRCTAHHHPPSSQHHCYMRKGHRKQADGTTHVPAYKKTCRVALPQQHAQLVTCLPALASFASHITYMAVRTSRARPSSHDEVSSPWASPCSFHSSCGLPFISLLAFACAEPLPSSTRAQPWHPTSMKQEESSCKLLSLPVHVYMTRGP